MSFNFIEPTLDSLFYDEPLSGRAKVQPSGDILQDDWYYLKRTIPSLTQSEYSPIITPPENPFNGMLGVPNYSDFLSNSGSDFDSFTLQGFTLTPSLYLKDIDFGVDLFSQVNEPDQVLNDALSSDIPSVSLFDSHQEVEELVPPSPSVDVIMNSIERLNIQGGVTSPESSQEDPVGIRATPSPTQNGSSPFLSGTPSSDGDTTRREPSSDLSVSAVVSTTKKALAQSPKIAKLKTQATARQKTLLQRIPIKAYLRFSPEDRRKLAAELDKKRNNRPKPVKFVKGCLPEKIREVLATPYRCYAVPKQENAKLLVKLLELNFVSVSPRKGIRKYRCRYSPEWLPPCEFHSAQNGSDMVRHLGTHANTERYFIDNGYLDAEDAAMLNIYQTHPALTETIDPDFCTCYVCNIHFVRKDSLERHYTQQHGADANLLTDLAAAVRGRRLNLGY